MERIDMEITRQALLQKGFMQKLPNGNGEYFTLRNNTWGHYIKVSLLFGTPRINPSTLVELCSYNESFIFARGVKTMEDIDELIRLFI